MFNTRANSGINSRENGVKLMVENTKKGGESELDVDVVLVSIGRHAFTDGLGLENTGVATNDRNQVVINDTW